MSVYSTDKHFPPELQKQLETYELIRWEKVIYSTREYLKFFFSLLCSHPLDSNERKADLTAVREEGEEEGRENLGCERDGEETLK